MNQPSTEILGGYVGGYCTSLQRLEVQRNGPVASSALKIRCFRAGNATFGSLGAQFELSNLGIGVNFAQIAA